MSELRGRSKSDLFESDEKTGALKPTGSIRMQVRKFRVNKNFFMKLLDERERK